MVVNRAAALREVTMRCPPVNLLIHRDYVCYGTELDSSVMPSETDVDDEDNNKIIIAVKIMTNRCRVPVRGNGCYDFFFFLISVVGLRKDNGEK